MNKMRIVGIDFGLSRLGIAISDPSQLIAFPLTTLKAGKTSEQTARLLLDYLNQYSHKQGSTLAKIVVGLPLMMSGKMGFLADEVEHFVAILRTLTAIPVETWDERLTSVQAERSLREGSLTRKRRSQMVDTVAAVIILQNYLDANRANA